MTRQEKQQEVESIVAMIQEQPNFYIADISGLTVAKNNELRRICFNKNIKVRVVKNALLEKAFSKIDGDFETLKSALKGNSCLFLSDSINEPAKVVKAFTEKNKFPILKGAYVESSVYVGGPELLDTLTKLKSREELIGEIIGLLQSPAKNVISALKSGGNTIAGLVKTLSER